MSACDVMQAAIVDEALPRPEQLEAHLASCEACASLARAHRVALRLSGVAPQLASRRSLAESRRRAGVVFGLVLAVLGGAGWVALEVGDGRAAPAPSAAPVTERVSVVAAGHDEFVALAALEYDVSASLHRGARTDEYALRFFGSLATWTEPTRTRPVSSLGKVASPVVYTQEDSP